MSQFLATFASRKFVLFATTIGMADLGWIYALVWAPDQLATVSTFLATTLAAYAGVNAAENYTTARNDVYRMQVMAAARIKEPSDEQR